MRHKADRDFSEGKFYQNVMDTHFSDENKAALKTVIEKATSPVTKDGVLNASYMMKTSHVIYRGNDLRGLAYLDAILHGLIIDELRKNIQNAYGPEFEVEYSDDRISLVHLPFSDVRITLKWAVPSKLASRMNTAYNVYVREMMKSSEIQALNHNQKMGTIASRWNALTEEEQKVYADLARNENDAAEE